MFPNIKPPFTHIERLLVEFSKIKKPSIADLMAFRTRAQVGDYLDKYRSQAFKMSQAQLQAEPHSSARMARYMRRAGSPRPSSRCDAHAIISGGHRDALTLRLLMAWAGIRVDDPFNGCWLPRDWEDQKHMPNYLRNAVPHRRIHHDQYYFWLRNRINPTLIKTPDQLINALRLIRVALQSGAVPPSVMPQTGR
ncbi:AHH domain-containing protein [Marinibactrum halimedae]|uniref:AHH domain-containing protein n=1 Tax=Marinibactrum halimedae TaxID=1444977 RepID=UPI001E451628|nr:AHH domain-containing protein [Marinibactrum halimedae]MCD9461003.1 AHH domain-containing protein [Marinibactrum halimedae]